MEATYTREEATKLLRVVLARYMTTAAQTILEKMVDPIHAAGMLAIGAKHIADGSDGGIVEEAVGGVLEDFLGTGIEASQEAKVIEEASLKALAERLAQRDSAQNDDDRPNSSSGSKW